VKCLESSSTAEESMLELVVAHSSGVYASITVHSSRLCWSITAHTAQLTKCDGVFSNPKGLVFWNGESSACAIQSNAEEGPRKMRNYPIFSFTKPQNTCFPVQGGRETPKVDL